MDIADGLLPGSVLTGEFLGFVPLSSVDVCVAGVSETGSEGCAGTGGGSIKASVCLRCFSASMRSSSRRKSRSKTRMARVYDNGLMDVSH